MELLHNFSYMANSNESIVYQVLSVVESGSHLDLIIPPLPKSLT